MKKTLLFTAVALIVLVAGYGLWYFLSQNDQEATSTQDNETEQQPEPEPELSLEERFVEAYYQTDYPNLEELADPPEITGNEEADEHIQELAEDRGYRLQRLPGNGLEEVQGVRVQPQLKEAWSDLQTAAIEDGVYLGLVSGYRSVEDQREIFLNQLRERAIEEQNRGFSNGQIAEGDADAVINSILSEYSIPGYSKHHSGYIIDITDTASDKPFEEFADTDGYEWVIADDYANIREHGFVPSYPEGVENLGPEPEPWEYVWIGPEATGL